LKRDALSITLEKSERTRSLYRSISSPKHTTLIYRRLAFELQPERDTIARTMSIGQDTLPEPLLRFDTTPAINRRLELLDELTRTLRTTSGTKLTRSKAAQAMRIALTYHSNAIEGNTLSLRQTQLVIEGKSPGEEKDLREIDEARNHDRALRLIESWATDRQRHPLNINDVLDVHSTVMADIDLSGAGRLRSGRVLIAGTGYIPPGSHRFDELLATTFVLAHRDDVHPVLRAAELHYNLAAIHPFDDGNGRTSRLMMNDLLLRHDYAFSIIQIGQRGAYLAALDKANSREFQPFAELVIDSVITTTKQLLGDESSMSS
jgi:Fic family protein